MTCTNINTLLKQLSDPRPDVAKNAVSALVNLGPDSVDPLLQAYQKSQDQNVQAYIIQALARIGDTRSRDLLIEIVGVEVANHCQGNIRRVAARGLGVMGSKTTDTSILSPAIDKLTWALTNAEDWALRYAAAVALEEIGTPAAVTALQNAQTNESDLVVQTRIQTALESQKQPLPNPNCQDPQSNLREEPLLQQAQH
ncbi:HEAT repeat domain-containing protein [Geitlerinema sp. PCC 9228]|uniref:HEAT repeat domain-containing protein n=1 Tax=Geitlerinema sp. PCC 9228 TaxID=111611 RepID=UPI0008F9AADA|nr:HEAT repeat domain-containing protein [Geitlerinema sp. PCC 9228]